MSNEKEKPAEFKLPEIGPNDFPISGLVLGVQSDSITYVSKKTNLQTEAKRDVIILQTSYGIVLCRAFNPSLDLAQLKPGMQVTFALTEYHLDNGVKNASIRI